MDAGREGELIFRYVVELAGATSVPVERFWASSLTDAAVRAAQEEARLCHIGRHAVQRGRAVDGVQQPPRRHVPQPRALIERDAVGSRADAVVQPTDGQGVRGPRVHRLQEPFTAREDVRPAHRARPAASEHAGRGRREAAAPPCARR